MAARRFDKFSMMLEKDPHDVDPDAIKDIRVLRTVVGGRTMHSKDAA